MCLIAASHRMKQELELRPSFLHVDNFPPIQSCALILLTKVSIFISTFCCLQVYLFWTARYFLLWHFLHHRTWMHEDSPLSIFSTHWVTSSKLVHRILTYRNFRNWSDCSLPFLGFWRNLNIPASWCGMIVSTKHVGCRLQHSLPFVSYVNTAFQKWWRFNSFGVFMIWKYLCRRAWGHPLEGTKVSRTFPNKGCTNVEV